jgi:hypothetical protein
MAFSIRNQQVEKKARAYAATRGASLTGALEMALDLALAHERHERDEAYNEWKAAIREIQKKVAQSPATGLTEQDIMGWDENGLPT